MSIALSPSTLTNYIEVIAELDLAKKTIKKTVIHQVAWLAPLNTIILTCLVLSILAAAGVLAKPHTVGWKCGIGFSAYLGLTPISTSIMSFFFINSIKNHFHIKKIDSILRKKNELKPVAHSIYLPKELVKEVFSYLNYKDLAHAAVTCKAWSQVAQLEKFDEKFKALIDQQFPNYIKLIPLSLQQEIHTHEREFLSAAYKGKFEKAEVFKYHRKINTKAWDDYSYKALNLALTFYFAEEEIFIPQISEIETVFS